MSGGVAELVDDLRDRVEHTATAVKIIDFVLSHWWFILLCVAVVAAWPRRRNS